MKPFRRDRDALDRILGRFAWYIRRRPLSRGIGFDAAAGEDVTVTTEYGLDGVYRIVDVRRRPTADDRLE